jgi:ribose transport system substrate-binding protein
MGRSDIVVTTVDLGPDTAMYVTRAEIPAIGAQLPYGLGIAEANAAAYALLGKPVPPYISLPALRVKKANGLSALELVTEGNLAERVGFEPTVRLHAQRFSRPSRSTTPAPLRMRLCEA